MNQTKNKPTKPKNKQTNIHKQTNKQTQKQTNKQTNKQTQQTNKQTNTNKQTSKLRHMQVCSFVMFMNADCKLAAKTNLTACCSSTMQMYRQHGRSNMKGIISLELAYQSACHQHNARVKKLKHLKGSRCSCSHSLYLQLKTKQPQESSDYKPNPDKTHVGGRAYKD